MHCGVHVLTWVMFLFGALTSITLCLAVSTDSWILMRELVPITDENGTVWKDFEPIWMITWTGLWKFCVMAATAPDFVSCSPVNYELGETGRESGAVTSMTIIAAMRGSVPLPVAGLILAFIGDIFCVSGSIHRDIKTLIAAIFYVLAGLAIAVGIILFISAINDEEGYRTSAKKEQGGFYYTYGWSFFATGLGFVTSEITAVITVTLYLQRNVKLEDMMKIIPGLETKVDVDFTSDSKEGILNLTATL